MSGGFLNAAATNNAATNTASSIHHCSPSPLQTTRLSSFIVQPEQGGEKNTAIKAKTILRQRKRQKSVPAIPAVLNLSADFPSESNLYPTQVGKHLVVVTTPSWKHKTRYLLEHLIAELALNSFPYTKQQNQDAACNRPKGLGVLLPTSFGTVATSHTINYFSTRLYSWTPIEVIMGAN